MEQLSTELQKGLIKLDEAEEARREAAARLARANQAAAEGGEGNEVLTISVAQLLEPGHESRTQLDFGDRIDVSGSEFTGEEREEVETN